MRYDVFGPQSKRRQPQVNAQRCAMCRAVLVGVRGGKEGRVREERTCIVSLFSRMNLSNAGRASETTDGRVLAEMKRKLAAAAERHAR